MAKKRKYHQSVKDRLAESRGMERYETKKKISRYRDAEYYVGMDARRRRELEDANMIHEDHNAIANLPQNVIMKEYPKPRYGMYSRLDDTIRGIDNQIDDDSDEMKREEFPEKY